MTIQDATDKAREKLTKVTDTPELDARWILLEVLGETEDSFLITHADQDLTLQQQNKFDEMIRRRSTGEPLAYILGWWEFHSRRFTVTLDVLVPRPSTEDLVNEALKAIDSMYTKLGRKLKVADVGTGSGIIAITLLLERPDKIEMVYATDVSPTALKVARKNAEMHGVNDQIEFVEGDMLRPLEDKDIDLIVSNPPYVPRDELNWPPTMDTVSLGFEPKVALSGGADGQKFVRQLEDFDGPVIYEGIYGDIVAK